MIIINEVICPNCLNDFEVESDTNTEEFICPFCKRYIKKDDNEFDE